MPAAAAGYLLGNYDLDTLLHEATTLDGAVCLIGRITRAEERRRTPDD